MRFYGGKGRVEIMNPDKSTTKKDKRRIARELMKSYGEKLKEVCDKMPPQYNGRHIRAVLAMIVDDKSECVRIARNEIKKDGFWYKF